MKAFTDIEQSEKLAEILPIESADMWWAERYEGHTTMDYQYVLKETPYYYLSLKKPSIDNYSQDAINDIPCWSLAALLEQLDDEITDEDGNDYNLTIVKENLQYQLYYHDSWGQVEDIETDYYDDLVDACYEMILKLHEVNLL